jgi:hypothetical protein
LFLSNLVGSGMAKGFVALVICLATLAMAARDITSTARADILCQEDNLDTLKARPGPVCRTGEKKIDPVTLGLQGPAGPEGSVGPKGADGAVGPEGPEGPVGPKGADGAVGPAGPEGPVGPKGAVGAVGPEGPVGSKGVDGAVGPAGPEGPVGSKGADGAVGPAGPPGPTGGNAIYACSCTPQRPVLTTESTCRKHCPKGAESCEPVACKLLGHLEP